VLSFEESILASLELNDKAKWGLRHANHVHSPPFTKIGERERAVEIAE
jgi:hypothetical protein